jgi:hypothetical protein
MYSTGSAGSKPTHRQAAPSINSAPGIMCPHTHTRARARTHTHTYAHMHARAHSSSIISGLVMSCHVMTHTYTQRERERERDRESIMPCRCHAGHTVGVLDHIHSLFATARASDNNTATSQHVREWMNECGTRGLGRTELWSAQHLANSFWIL